MTHSGENGNSNQIIKALKPPIVRRGKLVVVDLAGSERIDKSGFALTDENKFLYHFLFYFD